MTRSLQQFGVVLDVVTQAFVEASRELVPRDAEFPVQVGGFGAAGHHVLADPWCERVGVAEPWERGHAEARPRKPVAQRRHEPFAPALGQEELELLRDTPPLARLP